MSTSSQIPDSLLSRVRALLAKAEDPAATTAESEAFMAKAVELMAKYGIEEARLADRDPQASGPGDRIITVPNPWGADKARLVYRIAEALRCKALLLGHRDSGTGVHLFGFASDLERAEVLYTSLLLQMANGLAKVQVPAWDHSPRAYRRSWLVGFIDVVVERVEEAERRAAAQEVSGAGRSTDLVLADRRALVLQRFAAEYPRVRSSSMRFTGAGYREGQAAGRRANIGQTGIRGARRAIGGAR